MFPTVSTDSEAHQWVAPTKPKPSLYKASASHCFAGDTVEALGDGLEPTSSNDHSIPRFTWWTTAARKSGCNTTWASR